MSPEPAGSTAEVPLMTRPWLQIERFYRGQVERGLNVRAMLRRVEQIEASRYGRALHAWTSMHDLCIVQVPCSHPYDGPYLRISPSFDGTIEFRYIDTYIEQRQWHRRVSEADVFRRLERFIDQLHWVAREKAALS
ncbi:MAG TPA: hypothetical protein VN524_07280 [Hyphomicrobiaceae bacterium]|jgi:hypothetical protein|nr:hypothetical protein [Hyphomicrobiaceae bacterium]